MSCALASPENGVCANKRPVQGRRAAARRAVDQAQLTPLAAGHAITERPAVAASAPFTADAPEATFSMTQLREAHPGVPEDEPTVVPMRVQGGRTAPPSFREIRSGRAAAASRAPVAQVQIPADELDGGTLLGDAAAHAPAATAAMLPGMDQLVERVRQRTAARLSRAGSLGMA